MIENVMWVEKYRPKHIEDLVLSDNYRKVFEEWIRNEEIPHTLFVGKPGSGKTTLAQILVDTIIKDKHADVLVLNGSMTRGIGTVRDIIEEFLKCMTFGTSKIKIVFIDEFDGMTVEAQNGLKNMIEKYTATGRFLLTANEESKIVEPIISRVQKFRFKEMPKEFIFDYIVDVLKKEKISYDKKQEVMITKAINTFYPDIRQVINTVQMKCADGKLILTDSDLESAEKVCRSYITDLIVNIINKNSPGISKAITSLDAMLKEKDTINYREFYEQLCDDDNIPAWAQIVIEKCASEHINAMVPRFHVKAMAFRICEVGKKYVNL